MRKYRRLPEKKPCPVCGKRMPWHRDCCVDCLMSGKYRPRFI